MSWILALAGLLVGGYGLIVFSDAETVMHQIVAVGMWATGAVLFAGGAIVAAVERIPERQQEFTATQQQHARARKMAQADTSPPA